MNLNDFNYHLPKNLIAQNPVKPRDRSRLLVLDKKSGKIEHKHFYDILDYFEKGDVLVLNNSKVFPARLIGKKAGTGGRIEVFLLKHREMRVNHRRDEAMPRLYNVDNGKHHDDIPQWQCLLGGRGSKEGLEIEFAKGLKCEVIKNNNDGTWEVSFNMPRKKMMELVEKIGRMPLPPYVKRDGGRRTADNRNYQTIYADEKKVGSVAAPTAGFHFTRELIKKLKNKGARFEYITLHVGLGTFAPVKVDDITKHKMHAETVEIKKSVAQRIIKAKKEGRRIIAVGTTSVRALEGCLSDQVGKDLKQVKSQKSKIKNFIYPGYKFKIIDAMITNFHLPKSTLLMLVSAFAGKKNIDKAYKEAVKKKYRFYSYGDAMFIY